MWGSNLRRLHGLKQVPCDTILRRRLDWISPVQLCEAFQKVLQRAQRRKMLSRMMSWCGHYLVAVGGTGTFSSRQVHGLCCLQTQHRDGSTSYAHQQLCAVMVHPDRRQVLPMVVEVRSATVTISFKLPYFGDIYLSFFQHYFSYQGR